MRFSRSAKATALLLLVSFQYTFAALDVAICSSALCYPKVTGGKVQKAQKNCPEGFSMEKDAGGKAMCMKHVAKACAKKVKTTCAVQIGGACPSGSIAKKDCGPTFEVSMNKTGRHLLSGGNPLVKEINVVGHHMGMPHIILPKPAVSINVAPPPKPSAPPSVKFNGGSHGFPQIILPEPKVSITMPPMPKMGPEVKFEGGGHRIIPHIIPVLPQPMVTVEVPKGGYHIAPPQIKTELSSKKVTLDLSQLGPKHTLDVNLPAMPSLWHQATKMPDIEVNLPDVMPKVIDLTSLGPKKVYNITLPQVKVPKQGSITFRGTEETSAEPKFLDLTHLGPKHKTGINVKLPEVETNGATINVIVDDDKSIKDGSVIVVPGHKEKHNTVINVPGHGKDFPEKQAKLVIDVAANKDSAITAALEKLDELKGKTTTVEKVNIKMPDFDLTKHLPAGKDIVVEMKPLIKFDHGSLLEKMPNVTNIEKRVNIDMKNITVPRLVKDTTIVVKPLEVGAVAKHLLPKKIYQAWEEQNSGNSTGNSTIVTTTTTINMPSKTLPAIPVPKDKIDAAVSIPLKMGFAHNGTQPDGMINIAYKEEWVGGNPVLPNPGAAIVKKAEHFMDALSSVHCPTQCCTDVEEDECAEAEVQTVEPTVGCDEGWTLDAAAGTCSNGEVKVGACPDSMSKCHIDGKGVCVPVIDGKQGTHLCAVFKAVCHKGTVLAKSCTA